MERPNVHGAPKLLLVAHCVQLYCYCSASSTNKMKHIPQLGVVFVQWSPTRGANLVKLGSGYSISDRSISLGYT